MEYSKIESSFFGFMRKDLTPLPSFRLSLPINIPDDATGLTSFYRFIYWTTNLSVTLHSFRHSISEDDEGMASQYTLTPKQLHYLKRELITLEIQKEFKYFSENTTLSALFPPGSNTTTFPPAPPDHETPLLRFIFTQFVLTFPFLSAQSQTNSDGSLWIKLQHFLDEVHKLGISDSTERAEQSRRRKLAAKFEKMFVILFGSGIRINEGKEESISVEPESLAELAKEIEGLQIAKEQNEGGKDSIEINIVTVRDTMVKGKLKESAHSEFVIETKINDGAPTYVARRHGQFRMLAEELFRENPLENLPSCPSKTSSPYTKVLHAPTAHHKYREKDRLVLRGFLNRLAMYPKASRSKIFIDFLTRDPITLNHEEQYDAEKRAQADQARIAEEERFRAELDQNVKELNTHLTELKQEIITPGGLIKLFNIIKDTDRIEDLPTALRKTFEYGRLNFAFILHTNFYTTDSAPENLIKLKRIHSLVPYKALWGILKISNPMLVMKGVLDLFLAQPMGTRSLLQRIMLANLDEGAQMYQKDIDALQEKINDPAICEKIRFAVYDYRKVRESDEDHDDIKPNEHILHILRNEAIQPTLTPDQIILISSGTPEQRRILKELHSLWVLYVRKRDYEMLMKLVFQGSTGELIKDIFAIFYQPLAQVYKAANIADSLTDVQTFFDDLIKFVESLDQSEQSNTIQAFIELIQRHEQKFYNFVHNVHKQDMMHLFDNLLNYMDLIVTFMRQGTAQKVDLHDVIGHSIMKGEWNALVSEIDLLCEFHLRRKQLHLEKVRRKIAEGAEVGGMVLQEDGMLVREAIMEEMVKLGGDHTVDDMEELDFVDDYSSDEDTEDESPEKHVKEKKQKIKPPKLVVIPKLVPKFTEFATAALASS